MCGSLTPDPGLCRRSVVEYVLYRFLSMKGLSLWQNKEISSGRLHCAACTA